MDNRVCSLWRLRTSKKSDSWALFVDYAWFYAFCRERLLLRLIASATLSVQIKGAFRHSRLSDLNEIPIRIPHVAAQFRCMDFGQVNVF